MDTVWGRAVLAWAKPFIRLATALGLCAGVAVAQITADFTATPVSGPLPLVVKFHDATTGGTSVLSTWKFGDGGTSLQKNPTHTYVQAGTYTVKLSVQTADFHQDSETKTDFITVLPAEFSVGFASTPQAGQVPLEVQFTDETGPSGPSSWSWDFGDGNASTAQHPSHLYTAPGLYSVTLSVDVYGRPSQLTLDDLIQVDPAPLLPSFEASNSTGVQPLAVAFEDTTSGVTPTGWLWDFGDGSTSTEQHPSHTYSLPGDYDVTLDVAYFDQHAAVTQPDLVHVSPAEFAPDFAATPTVGDASLAVQFSDTSTGAATTAWSWSFGDGATSDEPAPQHLYAQPGVYSVTLTTWVGGVSQSITKPDVVRVGPFGGIYVQAFFSSLASAWAYGPWSVAAHGDLAVEGSPLSSGASEFDGRAHVFHRSADGHWSLEAALIADDASELDFLGISVATWGRHVLAGAHGADGEVESSGAAYLFERSSDGRWTQQARLEPSLPETNSGFGTAVALWADRALVGAPNHDTFGSSAGAAFVYERQASGAWLEMAVLAPPDPVSSYQFGIAVALSDDWALVGNPLGSGASSSDGGRAELFRRDGSGAWLHHATFTAAHPHPSDRFGGAVALQADRALVGASGMNTWGWNAGAVTAFERDDDVWVLTDTLICADGAPFDEFGRTVALDGDRAVIGSPYHDAAGPNAGATFVFERRPNGRWTQIARLLGSAPATPGPQPASFFGRGVALAGETVCVSGRHEQGTDLLDGFTVFEPVTSQSGPASADGGDLRLLAGDDPGCLRVTGATPHAAVLVALTAAPPPFDTDVGLALADPSTLLSCWCDADGLGEASLQFTLPAESTALWARAIEVTPNGITTSGVLRLR